MFDWKLAIDKAQGLLNKLEEQISTEDPEAQEVAETVDQISVLVDDLYALAMNLMKKEEGLEFTPTGLPEGIIIDFSKLEILEPKELFGFDPNMN